MKNVRCRDCAMLGEIDGDASCTWWGVKLSVSIDEDSECPRFVERKTVCERCEHTGDDTYCSICGCFEGAKVACESSEGDSKAFEGVTEAFEGCMDDDKKPVGEKKVNIWVEGAMNMPRVAIDIPCETCIHANICSEKAKMSEIVVESDCKFLEKASLKCSEYLRKENLSRGYLFRVPIL